MQTISNPASDGVWVGPAHFRTLYDSDDYDIVESVQPAGEQTPLHRHGVVSSRPGRFAEFIAAVGTPDQGVEVGSDLGPDLTCSRSSAAPAAGSPTPRRSPPPSRSCARPGLPT